MRNTYKQMVEEAPLHIGYEDAVVNDVVNYGSGMLTGTKVVPATPTAEVCALRLKTLGTPNVFEIYIGRASAAHRYAYAFIQYFV